jgi:hypothetical protein
MVNLSFIVSGQLSVVKPGLAWLYTIQALLFKGSYGSAGSPFKGQKSFNPILGSFDLGPGTLNLER